MVRKNLLWICGLGVALAVGVLVGRWSAEAPKASNAQDVVAAIGAAQNPSSYDFQSPRDADAPRPLSEAVDDAFSFQRVVMDTGEAYPKACFQFSAPLNMSGEVRYADFVRFTPAEKVSFSVTGSSLCVEGLAFDATYAATLRAGLPSADGDTLKRAERITVAFGDKPAYVGFAGDGVILPRIEADGIGIETVNVERVGLEIYRVSDRALARKSLVSGETNAANRYSYIWDENDGANVGVRVFEGDVETAGERNEVNTTILPLGAALGDIEPGAYFIKLKDRSAGAAENRAAGAWRWVLFTDMAMTSVSGGNGIDLFLRSIDTAKPLRGVKLQLIAQNNDLLGEAITNSDGRARFPAPLVNGEYPLTPKMIFAFGPQDDFAALDLTRAPLDLTSFPVGGRSVKAGVDGYVYFDRGVYRPGETAFITGLLRDSAGHAIASRPATIKIYRPNGTIAEQVRVDALELGSLQYNYRTPDTAPRGMWRVDVYVDGEEHPVATASFSVEDFVPQRLAVDIVTDEETPIRSGESRILNIESRYLYGAPAADLAVEGEARLRLDPNPFPAFAGYRFGASDARFDERIITLESAKTDSTGKVSLPLKLDVVGAGQFAPMRADVVAGVVEPGGRVVRDSVRIPVRASDYYVGLRLPEGQGNFSIDEVATISAALVDWQGQGLAGDIEWKLYQQDYWFDWYRDGGAWRWRRQWRDNLLAEGRSVASDKGLADLVSQRLEQGSYRLVATRAGGKESTALNFYVGWRSYAADVDAPDQASLTLQNEKLTPGARARFVLDAPYEGEAIVTVATDRVHHVKRMRLDGKAKSFSIETNPDWGAGFYVMATVVTPRNPGAQPVPRRAMGVAYAPFDMSARTLSLNIDMPKTLRPRQDVVADIHIDGAERGEALMLTLAAVDEGILRLTKFSSPDPTTRYFGKNRLGVSVRDDYGRILNANLGAPSRFGGDQLGGEGLTVVPTKSVALFSGLVAVDDNGHAKVPVSLPDFNGELRLMAVAWTDDKLGAAQSPLIVRDPAPAELAMSRFIAPGDKATATLVLNNIEGGDGQYRVSVRGEGPISIAADKTYSLVASEMVRDQFTFSANGLGVGAIVMEVEGPDGFSVTRHYPIQSRSPFFPVTEVRTAPLDPGEGFLLTSAIFEGLQPGSSAINLSFSPVRGVEPGPLLDSLNRYPWGCTEQLVSSSFPLLYVDVLGGSLGREDERAVRPRVQAAVNKLLNRQSPDGAFGLWRVGDRHGNAWLAPYVTDFLYRAKSEGYGVPDPALHSSYKILKQIARMDRWYLAGYQTRADESDQSNDSTEQLRRRVAAFAMYVLARGGEANLSDLRYFHDALLSETKNPLARAHIGAALALMGDRARAKSAFDQAVAALGRNNTGDYYQTPLRDAAGALALALETGQDAIIEPLTDKLVAQMKDPDQLHTQEKAFVLMAAQAMLRSSGDIAIQRNGELLALTTASPSFALSAGEIEEGLGFANVGDGRIYRSLSVSGVPLSKPMPVASGVSIDKRLATLDGQTVDIGSIRQNDRFVTIISGQPKDKRLHPFLVADLLPAGFEIETILEPADGARENADGAYGWVGAISRTRVAEARDDRFVAAIDIRDQKRFTLAYVVRAVTPGAFTAPGVVVEDMYRPGVFARSDAVEITIGTAQ